MWSGTSSLGRATRASGKSGKSRTSGAIPRAYSPVPKTMRSAIVWFRRDLRVRDHPALTAAHREADRVVPLYVLDPRLLDAGRFPSRNRAWFLLASLRELRAALRGVQPVLARVGAPGAARRARRPAGAARAVGPARGGDPGGARAGGGGSAAARRGRR